MFFYHKKNTCFLLLLLILSLVCSCLSGCSGLKKNSNGSTKVVLTTGFKRDEVFRIENSSCSLSEVRVYLMNTKNQYENTFGKEIWKASYNDETLEDNIKETVLARLARIKALNLLALDYGISLTDEEHDKAGKAAQIYYASLNDNEKQAFEANEDVICKMYEEYALSDKVYEYLIADINPEISDDEARTITVQHIFIKTYSLNEDNERVEYSEQAKKEAYNRAREALRRARDGEEFTSLIAEYSEDENATYSFGKGSMDSAFEEAAFNLATDEISDIVETPRGYHIIKCISTFNKDETDRNKVKIVEQRRKEVFNEEYSGFVGRLTRNINQELWDSVSFIEDEEVKTDSFFDVYRQVFYKE